MSDYGAQQRVAQLRSYCGCTAGGLASTVALILYPVVGIVAGFGEGLGMAPWWLFYALTVVASGAMGKVSVLLYVRYQLRKLEVRS